MGLVLSWSWAKDVRKTKSNFSWTPWAKILATEPLPSPTQLEESWLAAELSLVGKCQPAEAVKGVGSGGIALRFQARMGSN